MTPLELSARKAAAADYVNAHGLATPDLDPAQEESVVSARAVAVLTHARLLAQCSAHDLAEWGRIYTAVVRALQADDLLNRLATLDELETRGWL